MCAYKRKTTENKKNNTRCINRVEEPRETESEERGLNQLVDRQIGLEAVHTDKYIDFS